MEIRDLESRGPWAVAAERGLRLSKSRISTDSLYNLYIEDLEMYVTKGLRLSKSRISTDSLYNLYLDFRHAEKKGGRSPKPTYMSLVEIHLEDSLGSLPCWFWH